MEANNSFLSRLINMGNTIVSTIFLSLIERDQEPPMFQ
jgi:hypothetical protein